MSDPEELFRPIHERLLRVRSMISAEKGPKPPAQSEGSGGRSEVGETEPRAEGESRDEAESLSGDEVEGSSRRETETQDAGAATPPWPAWAVVDWTQAVDERAPGSLRGLSDVAVPVMEDEEEVIRIEDPQPIDVGSTGQPDPTRAPSQMLRPEVVHRPSAREGGLAIPPTRLAELLREASFAAQEARERAARWQGEARVLREELERERAERGHERAERERLMVELAKRHRWWSPSS
jgi:hypothetical protein